MICPNCQHDNFNDAVTCRDCKTPFGSKASFCGNGHTIDPTWTECNYCRAEGRLGSGAAVPYRPAAKDAAAGSNSDNRKTILEPAGKFNAPSLRVRAMQAPLAASQPPLERPLPAVAAVAVPSAERSGATTRKTMFYIPEPKDSAIPAIPQPSGSKIVAILVTYSRRPEGEIFPIREGRNRIGSDPAQSDIAVEQDSSMSAIHSSISFRTRFVISDRDSMSGTYVNGCPVEEEAFPLENYARIRTGSTTWLFVILEPKPAVLAG